MTIAILTDLHANRAAIEACLDDAARRGARRLMLLGDYVGYGPDPEWTLDRVAALIADGAVAIQGNHDAAIDDPAQRMNPLAAEVIAWTRPLLAAAQRRLLAELPLTYEEDGLLLTHGAADRPGRFGYVADGDAAAEALRATRARLQLCGHVHAPALYAQTATGRLVSHRPTAGAPVPLSGRSRWLAVVGSVGQPRDGDPAAAYALLDPDQGALTFVRVPYDVAATAARIRARGLPERLAERLAAGR